MRARAWAHALMAMRKWPEKWIDEGGPDLELARSATSCTRPSSSDDAVDRLKPLTDDAAYVKRRPAVLYYLARAEYGNGMFEPAVRNMDQLPRRDHGCSAPAASGAGALTTLSKRRMHERIVGRGHRASSVSAAAVVARRASSSLPRDASRERRLVAAARRGAAR